MEQQDVEDENTHNSSPGGWQGRLSAFLHVHRGSRASSRKSSRASDASDISELGTMWLNLPLLLLTGTQANGDEEPDDVATKNDVCIMVSEPSPEAPPLKLCTLDLPSADTGVCITVTEPSPESPAPTTRSPPPPQPPPHGHSDVKKPVAESSPTPPLRSTPPVSRSTPKPPPPPVQPRKMVAESSKSPAHPRKSISESPPPKSPVPTPTHLRKAVPESSTPKSPVLSHLQRAATESSPPPPPPCPPTQPAHLRRAAFRRMSEAPTIVHALVHRESEEYELDQDETS